MKQKIQNLIVDFLLRLLGLRDKNNNLIIRNSNNKPILILSKDKEGKNNLHIENDVVAYSTKFMEIKFQNK